FEKLVEELEPERNLSHNPLMQVLFVLQNAPVAPEARSNTTIAAPELAPGLRVELGGVASDQAKFDLTLALQEEEAGLNGEVEYGTDLFDATTIRRLVGHFRTLLEDVAADPERRLSELRWLSPPEEQQLLREWIGVIPAYPRDAAIHELFAARAANSPDAVAVVFGGSGLPDEHLSYRELDRRAKRLAHLLRSCGVGPEVCVGLCLERSVEMVVAILGILKAGGAYLPLGPSDPAERLAFMLTDAGSADGRPPVLVVRDRLPERLRAAAATLPEPRLIRLDRDAVAG
ncbi:MAG: AMP-binding protein, partial [bacterium]|nr:AMP-binding protein [bacterium]